MPSKNSDKNFDSYNTRLKNNVYGSLKGKIRLKILSHDLENFLNTPESALNVLDAGCGLGQCAALLALNGHHLTMCDISQNMLDDAQNLFESQNIKNAHFINESIQEHARKKNSYDLILCHAVLEWTENPQIILNSLKAMLKPKGKLSLMFFNRNGAIFKAIIRGNFYPKDKGFKFGQTKGLTPTNPLNPDTVYQWVTENDLEIIEKSGVRVFYDYCEKSIRDQLNEEQVLNCELSFSRCEPFLSSARYIHILCQS